MKENWIFSKMPGGIIFSLSSFEGLISIQKWYLGTVLCTFFLCAHACVVHIFFTALKHQTMGTLKISKLVFNQSIC